MVGVGRRCLKSCLISLMTAPATTLSAIDRTALRRKYYFIAREELIGLRKFSLDCSCLRVLLPKPFLSSSRSHLNIVEDEGLSTSEYGCCLRSQCARRLLIRVLG